MTTPREALQQILPILERLSRYPRTRGDEMSAETMRAVSREALAIGKMVPEHELKFDFSPALRAAMIAHASGQIVAWKVHEKDSTAPLCTVYTLEAATAYMEQGHAVTGLCEPATNVAHFGWAVPQSGSIFPRILFGDREAVKRIDAGQPVVQLIQIKNP